MAHPMREHMRRMGLCLAVLFRNKGTCVDRQSIAIRLCEGHSSRPALIEWCRGCRLFGEQAFGALMPFLLFPPKRPIACRFQQSIAMHAMSDLFRPLLWVPYLWSFNKLCGNWHENLPVFDPVCVEGNR